MPDTLYATLCSGIECAGLAAEGLGWVQAFSSEIDPFACAVLDCRRPDVPNLGDMTLLADRIRREGGPAPDVLIAGSPCQAFSVAGLQRSLDDERGNLTLELVNVLNAIDEVRWDQGYADCCTLVWENVPGVLSTKDNAFGCFLAALVGADEPLAPFGRGGRWPRAGLVRGPRRSAAWRILDAQWFGVAQRRRRVFLVAGAGERFDPAAVLLEPESLPGNPPPREKARQDLTGTISSRTSGGGGLGTDFECGGELICSDIANTIRVPSHSAAWRGDGADNFVAYGGNNTTGPINVATARSAHGGPHGRLDFETETFLVTGGSVTHALNTANNGKHCSEDGTGRGVPIIAFSAKDHGADAGLLAPTLRAMGFSGSHANEGCQVAVAFRTSANCGAWETGDRTDALTCGSDPNQHVVAFQSSQSGVRVADVHCTLDSNNGPRRHNGVITASAIRRLTPVECERLQGLPDNWTLIPVKSRKKLEADFLAYVLRHSPDLLPEAAEYLAADGPRYKAIGNGMAVPCMRWILNRLDLHMKGIL